MRLRGRISEAWPRDGAWHAILLVGDEAHVLRAGQPLGAGDIVAVEIGPDGTVTDLTRLGGPQAGTWDPTGDALRWRAPGRSPGRMNFLRQRQEIVRAIREDLHEQGFLEVQTPLLVKGACPDVAIESMETAAGVLVTSTEYQLKRLAAGGLDRAYTLTQNFRAGDSGRHHSAEFTMLEWYRAYAPLADIEADAERFIRRADAALHPRDDRPWERLTVREAMRRHLGVEVEADFSHDSLRRGAERAGVPVPDSFLSDRHALLSFLLDRMQPRLGVEVPTFLREWPAFMTSSALGERSELYIAGLEIADGFPFLRDPEQQRALFEREVALRAEQGRRPVALDQRYIEALRQGIPPGAGMALGLDRLVMALTGAERISDVQAFSWEEL